MKEDLRRLLLELEPLHARPQLHGPEIARLLETHRRSASTCDAADALEDPLAGQIALVDLDRRSRCRHRRQRP